MPRNTLEEKEEILDHCVELYLRGYKTSQQLFSATTRNEIGDLRTAKGYLRIVERRLRNQWRNLDTGKFLRKELQQLDLWEKLAAKEFDRATKPIDRARIIDSIIKIKERRAKLLSLDGENLAVSQKPKMSIYQQMVLNLPPENETTIPPQSNSPESLLDRGQTANQPQVPVQ